MSSLHHLIDRVFAKMVLKHRLYHGGFGDRSALAALSAQIAAGAQAHPEFALEVQWLGNPQGTDSLTMQRAIFESPAASLLPEASHQGFVEVWRKPTASDVKPPVLIMLAATAEAGFERRRKLLKPLVAEGLTVMFLENPYYGARRPAEQVGTRLATVKDQFAMNLATVCEAMALVHWLKREGHTQIGLGGYSQGGFMAAFAAAALDLPVAVAALATGADAGPVFTQGGLASSIDWQTLAHEVGGLDAARTQLEGYLAPVNLLRFAPPKRPQAAILLAATHDAFVTLDNAKALHTHWQGSELRVLPSGHVTTVLFHAQAQRQAIRDAMARLTDAG